ncbi:NAD-dependent protein deacetylase [Spiribacter salinus]|uniref:NAD-dependent protein deacetylase n=1 Tax=Spiribacter salinus TaxID=1335746 RepID=UPI001C96134C|nr:NAD-dependent protein deacetylase [Spiribacter salinus]MBY5269390.1 NAD-dependent deacetylase [Spiribacter salinus]
MFVARPRPLLEPAPAWSADELAAALRAVAPVAVLTGAGVSTGSGIPDYRDHQGAWKRRAPMQLSEFTGSERGRQRYWARSLVGWRTVETAQPNPAHREIAALEARGLVGPVITQNVDGLHQAAGSRSVLDLHGRLDRVECLDCGQVVPRAEHQARLEAANPGWAASARQVATAPDGDADLLDADYSHFAVPGCHACGGLLKPAVVFFGETVPSARVEQAFEAVAGAGALLVVGSSLMVWSGYRFVRAAAAARQPVYVLGLGVTRGDAEADGRLTADCGEGLAALRHALDQSRGRM